MFTFVRNQCSTSPEYAVWKIGTFCRLTYLRPVAAIWMVESIAIANEPKRTLCKLSGSGDPSFLRLYSKRQFQLITAKDEFKN